MSERFTLSEKNCRLSSIGFTVAEGGLKPGVSGIILSASDSEDPLASGQKVIDGNCKSCPVAYICRPVVANLKDRWIIESRLPIK